MVEAAAVVERQRLQRPRVLDEEAEVGVHLLPASAGVLATATAMTRRALTDRVRGAGGDTEEAALKTSVLISACDVNVREFVPQPIVMPVLIACEPVT